MIIYKDIFTGDELFSDTYKWELVHDVVYKVKGKMVTKNADDIDDSLIGGNKSAEEQCEDESVQSTSTTEINLVASYKLSETPFGKKADYKDYIKGYMKSLEAKLKENQKDEDELKNIKKNLGSFVKEVLDEFKEYTFYMGESNNPEGMIVLMKWEENETVPCFYYFKDGLEEEKV